MMEGGTCGLILNSGLALSRLTCKGAILHRVQGTGHDMQRVRLGVSVRALCNGAVQAGLHGLEIACCATLWPEV